MSKFTAFQQVVLGYYRAHGRHDLPWRLPNTAGLFDPYAIMVSEIMLQQTQVGRVIPKFQQFLHTFPDVQTLSKAPLGEVLLCWSGLGYNRRAKFLWQASGALAHDFGGRVPRNQNQLVSLPGIGPNTAGAILVYAFNQPEVFIETNIRTVFIHHFFADEKNVPDSAIADLVRTTLPTQNAREWYWALMDYGTFLKQVVGNVSRQSRSFIKQSPFEGSRRQIRGKVLKLLAESAWPASGLQAEITDERLPAVLDELAAEGLVIHTEHGYMLPRI